MNRPTIITVIAIVLVFLLLGLAGGMDKADAAVTPLTGSQARSAVTRYLDHEQAVGVTEGGAIKSCLRADALLIRCQVVEYGVDAFGLVGNLSHRIDVERVGLELHLTSSLFGRLP
jgi:hypothetical protein